MNIALYNRWLTTLGGGERLSLAIAAHLARTHAVDVLSHAPVASNMLAERLDLDLSGVNFREAPMNALLEPSPYTEKYDLFINASNGDYIPPVTPCNAMLVYFPTSPPLRPGQRVRRFVARQIDRLATRPRYVNGVFGAEDSLGAEIRGLAQLAHIALPAASIQSYDVDFSLMTRDPAVHKAIIYLDSREVETVNFESPNDVHPIHLAVPPGPERVMTIAAVGGSSNHNIHLTMTPLTVSSRRARMYQRLFTEIWPELGVRQQNTPPNDIPGIVRGYQLLWAISRYTQRWIRAYWNLPSTLLYPPVPVEKFPPLSKRPIILSVGRFFAGSHNKKHLVMIDAFRRMLDDGLAGWELHLVGSATPGEQHQRYLEQVQFAAAGIPVRIHTNMGNEELAELYGMTSIYWHAAGYGEDPTREPGKFEHFGISVVEAMAAGCVPVVVGQGGLAELVHHARDGYLWYDTEQLRSITSALTEDDKLRSVLAQAAIVSSRQFSVQRFHTSLDESFASIMN